MLGTNEEIVWVSEDPEKLRYLLFQALSSAAIHARTQGEPYVSIALLRDKFKIRSEIDRVIATPRRVTPLAAVRAQAQKKIVIRDTTNIAEVLAALGYYKAASVIVFEGLDAHEMDLHAIYTAAEKHGYYMIPASTHLTFSKNPEDAEIAWTPEEE